jgi:hypothetical protein
VLIDRPKPRAQQPHKRTKPAPQPPPHDLFGPIGRADRPITRAQHAAHQRTQRATRKVERNVALPALPKLSHPTSAQRAGAANLFAGSARRQGVRTTSDVNVLPARERVRAHRAMGYSRTLQRRQEERVARYYGVQAGTHRELAAAGRAIAQARAIRARPGVHRDKVLAAGFLPGNLHINLSSVGRSLMSATSLNKGDLGPRTFFKGAASDIGALGTFPIVAGESLALGGYQAVRHGDTSRLRHLVGGAAQGLSHGFAGSLILHGDPNAAVEQLRHHPIFAALDLAGAESVVGRTAGALTRAAGSTVTDAGLRGSLARAGSTVRAPLALSNDVGAVTEGGLIHERTFSKSLSRKRAQATADSLREPLRHPDGSPVLVKQRGRMVPVLKARPGERDRLLRKRGDFRASRANADERLARDEASKAEASIATPGRGRRHLPQGKAGRLGNELLSMFIEGTIRSPKTFRHDLEAHLADLHGSRLRHEQALERDAPSPFRHTGELHANEQRAAILERALASEKVMASGEKLYARAAEQAGHLNAAEREAIRLGLIDARAARRSKLVVWAIDHMDARHVTVEEHQKLEQSARVIEQEKRTVADQLPAGSKERARAVKEWRQARATRIKVSGRDPKGVHAHEQAQSAARSAGQRAKVAEAAVARLERGRQRIIGAQQVRRGGPGGKPSGTHARGAKALANVNRKLEAARADAKAARKAAREADHTARTTKLPDVHPALRRADGSFLSDAQIEAHIREHRGEAGVDSIAFLPHRLDVRGGRAHHTQFRPGTRPNLDVGPTRTGEAYRRGSTGFGRELVHDQFSRLAVLTTKAQQLDRYIHDSGLRHPAWAKSEAGHALTNAEKRIVERGGLWTAKEAEEAAQRLSHDDSGRPLLVLDGEEYVPVRSYAASLPKETKDYIRENLQAPRAMESIDQRLLNDRVVNPTDAQLDTRARNIVLVPKAEFDRLEKHLRPAGDIQRFFQGMNRAFRMAVLPQPRWLAGNFIEPYFIRLPASGAGINVLGMAIDIHAAVKVLRRMERSGDPAMRAAAHEIRAQQLGGLFVSGGRGQVRRTVGEALPPSASKAYGRMVSRLPAVAQFGDLTHRVLHGLFGPLRGYFAFNRLIELGPQLAALGKSVREDVQAFTGSYFETLRMGEKAQEEAARGLMNTPTQQRVMAKQHELLGKYEGFSPVVRTLVQTAMPFIPWAASAARFVFWTMPAHHSALTDFLVKTEQVIGQDWNDQHADAPPGELQLAPRTPAGGYVDVARYTPYGISGGAVAGDYQNIINEIFPQLTGTVQAFQGRDPFGRDLRVAPSPGNPQGIPSGGQKAGIAAYGLAEALIPYLATARRLEEHGETAFAGSTVFAPRTKPNTGHGMSGLRRTFDPFRPTYLTKGGSGSSAPSTGVQGLLERSAGARGGGGLSASQQALLEAAADDRRK